MYLYLKLFLFKILEILALPFLCLIYIIIIIIKRRRKAGELPKLIWGADPVISHKYWSESLKEKGYFSKTMMNGFYSSINKKEDYDLYLDELLPFKIPFNFVAYYAFFYAVYNYDIIHHPANGFVLRFTFFMGNKEGYFIRKAGCKNIVLPYGADIWMYSKLNNTDFKHGFLLSYPKSGKNEEALQKKISYWIKNSDIFFPVHQTDGVGYWDLLCYNNIVIDDKKWIPVNNFSIAKNGVDDFVKIIHSPNHRGIKGTEFIIQAVEILKKEGLKIELILLEKVTNDVVKEIMNNADILVEQLILGHGLSAIEGMAKGLVVISNLEDDTRNIGFRTYSYLKECPIVSACPENIVDVLRKLVKEPLLRKELGDSGRAYVEKYHSYAFGQFLFGEIYKKIWHNEPVDLLNMFHPVYPGSYNNQSPLVKHPLIKNKLTFQ